jgi:hypothetical protein
VKCVAEFSGSCTNPKAADAKIIPEEWNLSLDNPAMEYTEYAVAVTSHWDKQFMQKFSTKSKSFVSCQLNDSTKFHSSCWKYHLDLRQASHVIFVFVSWMFK